VALSILGFWSCQRELLTVNDLDLTLRPGLVVPLGQIDLTLGDVFNPDSSLVTTDPDQTYRLVYRQTDLLNVGVSEFLELPSQPAIAENFKAGYISLSWIVPLHIPLLRLGPQAKKALDSAPIP
jgi:hypothetical protein